MLVRMVYERTSDGHSLRNIPYILKPEKLDTRKFYKIPSLKLDTYGSHQTIYRPTYCACFSFKIKHMHYKKCKNILTNISLPIENNIEIIYMKLITIWQSCTYCCLDLTFQVEQNAPICLMWNSYRINKVSGRI